MKFSLKNVIFFLMLLQMLVGCSIPTDFRLTRVLQNSDPSPASAEASSLAGAGQVSAPVAPPPAPPVVISSPTPTVNPPVILAPVVTGVSQANVLTAGGELITIIGSNFLPGATVSLAGTNAILGNFIDAEHLQITTPALPSGDISIRVTNPDSQFGDLSGVLTGVTGQIASPNPGGGGGSVGGGGGGGGGGVVVIPAPIVSAVSQATVSTLGGESLTIIGSNFLPGATVSLAGLTAIVGNFIDAEHLQITTPVLPSGDISIRVTNPDSQFGDLSGVLTAVSGQVASPNPGGGGGEVLPPITGPQSVVKSPASPTSVGQVDNDMYNLEIPHESASSIIGFSNFEYAIPANAVITKVSAKIHQYAQEEGGSHFYFILNFGVKDMLVELYDFVTGVALSPNRAKSQKISAQIVSPIQSYEYTLLESLDGTAVISPSQLNQMGTGLRLQYYNEYYKSDAADVRIDQIELIVDYH